MRWTHSWHHALSALCLSLVPLAPSTALAQSPSDVKVTVVEQGSASTLLRIEVGRPALTTVQTPAGDFLRFAQQGGGGVSMGTENRGQAELPVTGFPLALPVDLRNDPSVIVTPQGEPRVLRARVFPVQPPETAQAIRPELPRFEFDETVYRRGVRKAGEDLGRTAIFKGEANVEGFRFAPYGYDPVRQELFWHDSYLVSVRHAAGDCFRIDHLLDTRTRTRFDSIDQFVERMPLPTLRYVLNQQLVGKICPPFEIAPNLFGARFLIVTHPDFLAAANTLKTHKQAQGISTQVVTTQTIAGGVALTANKLQIRNWLANHWNTHLIKPKWVLLLGDAEKLPTSYDQVNSWDTARNASDIWYGQFQPGAGAETIPPFGIGRFPVDTPAQANTMVAKVMAFENHPPPDSFIGQDFYSRLTFASFFEGSGNTDQRWFAQVSEIVRNHAIAQGYAVRRIYAASNASNPQFWRGGAAIPAALRKPTFAWNGNAADVVDAVNNGTTLLYHRDHGWWDGWGDPAFHLNDLNAISVTNNRYPVVFSINCASGVFDGETVDLAGNIVGGGYMTAAQRSATWWAESFVRKADGALAVIGDTRSSSTVDNGHLTIGLFDAIFPGLAPGFGSNVPVRRLGDVLNHAKAFIAAVDAGTTANLHPIDVGGARPGIVNLRQELNLYNLLGDPTVKLRTAPPFNFSVVNIRLVQGIAQINVPIQCLTCPPGTLMPEMITAVAIDPASGRVLGRTLINSDGNGNIDMGNFTGNFVVRVASGDGASQQAALNETDSDGDGVPDSRDNCVMTPNANQKDSDGDGYGDACDGDINNDGIVNSVDLSLLRAAFGQRGVNRADLNGDGIVNALDLALLQRLFASRPGPSAWHIGAQ